MDELFGDVLDRGLAPRRRGGFSPAVDVYYASDPPRAVVRADLAGIDPDAVRSRSRGRELVLSGHRETESADDRVYQQLEIERGPFRRVVSLGAEVDADAADATYEDGILTVELPLSRPRGRAPSRSAGPRPVSATHRRRPPAAALPGPRCPVLPLRDTVTYPDTLTPLAVGQDRSIQLVNDVLTGDRMLVMLGSKDPELETPGPDQLHTVGVAGVVARMLKVPDGSLRILVQAGQRVRIDEWVGEEPYLVATVSELPDEVEEGPELTALMRNVQQTFTHIIEEVPYLPEELQMAVANLEDPSALAHLIAGALRIKVEEKQALLEEVDVGKRLRRLSEVLARELDIVAIGSKIQSQVMSEMESSQREYVLRQQLKAIQEELGEKDPAEAEIDDLRAQLAELELPEDVRKQADRELSRLEKLPQAAAEHGVIRTYLEWIASLPWDKRTDDNLDLAHAREVLDDDHYDIAKVKERILEFLAVRKLKPDATRLLDHVLRRPARRRQDVARASIARAMGRKFERI